MFRLPDRPDPSADWGCDARTAARSVPCDNVRYKWHGDNFPTGFVRGTTIEAGKGEVPVEQLAAGDVVRTLDHGLQPVVRVERAVRLASGDQAPVRFRAGTLSNHRDLTVAPGHRMLLGGWQTELLFGEPETLASARSLINDNSIRQVAGVRVEYVSLTFTSHDIVFAEGAACESLVPDANGLNA